MGMLPQGHELYQQPSFLALSPGGRGEEEGEAEDYKENEAVEGGGGQESLVLVLALPFTPCVA